MKPVLRVSCVFLLTASLLLPGCGDEDSPTTPGSSGLSWQTVFEDNFDGATLDTTTWTQVFDSPPPYSLTGSGELKIDGSSSQGDGAAFVYNTAISGDYVKIITKFRTTQKDSILDDVDMAIFLNIDDTDSNLYILMLTSDPFDDRRNYELIVAKITRDGFTTLTRELMGGTMPQIVAGTDYILEGTNANGTITMALKDASGSLIHSISVNNSDYSGGRVGIAGDLNIGTTPPQSIFFDYAKVQKYQ